MLVATTIPYAGHVTNTTSHQDPRQLIVRKRLDINMFDFCHKRYPNLLIFLEIYKKY
jgi:hypothetical protein